MNDKRKRKTGKRKDNFAIQEFMLLADKID
jgi:hypothetical protein